MSAAPRRRPRPGASRPDLDRGLRPVPDPDTALAPQAPPAPAGPRRRRWPWGLAAAAALALFITVAEDLRLAAAGPGIAGGAAVWALLTCGVFASGLVVRRWSRPAGSAAWRGVKSRGMAGYRLIRPSRGPGQPPDWSWVPDQGPWELKIRSRSGRELIPGHDTAVRPFADRDALMAELQRVTADPDLEVGVRTVPAAHPSPPAGPPPAPAAPGGPPLPGPARPNGGAGKRAQRRSGRLRIAAGAGGVTTAEWQTLITATADFEPDDDGEFLDWSAAQVIGLASYAEALIELFEHLVHVVGVDPAALDGLLSFADATADAADQMSQARADLASFYKELREAAAEGRPAPKYNGHWVTGQGEV